MNIFLMLMFLFFIGSILGWCLETIFRRFSTDNKTRAWINPGFMIGPYLPLYGFGLTVLYLLAELEEFLPTDNQMIAKVGIVIFMAIGMTLLELVAGLIFVRGMNLKLWDYSNKPFNYKGIICPQFTFYWVLLAMIYYFFIHPHIVSALDWFSSNIAFSFVLGMFYGVILIDFSVSMHIAAKIRSFAAENNIKVRYEELKANIRRYTDESKEKYRFLFAFQSKISLHEHLTRYFDLQVFKRNKEDSEDQK